jgi:hypothetical protein
MEMLSIAGEFDITPLKEIATAHCIDSLAVENFAAMLQLAHLHDNQDLKQACHKFAEENMESVLMHPELLKLANDYEDIWSELLQVCKEELRKRLRARGRLE